MKRSKQEKESPEPGPRAPVDLSPRGEERAIPKRLAATMGSSWLESERVTLPPRAHDSPSAWSSLLGDLGADPAPEDPRWRIHDRTNIEYSVEYQADPSRGSTEYEWEAYYFLPRSFRLSSATYVERDIYTDLRSYVRFAVPRCSFPDLEKGVERLREMVRASSTAAGEAQVRRELRLFACLLRGACMRAQREALLAFQPGAEEGKGLSRAMAEEDIRVLLGEIAGVLRRFREVVKEAEAQPFDEEIKTAWRWVDEDISRMIETVMAHLVGRLRRARGPEALREQVRLAAVAEARYRAERGLGGVGAEGAKKREVEHLEFQRRVLKRYTASVLWLRSQVRASHTLALEVLYAIAASVAMSFALAAALWNGPQASREHLWLWASVVVLAYAAKDRIKSGLQKIFDRFAKRLLPDRRWRFRPAEGEAVVAQVDERSGFVPFQRVPEEVLQKRRLTRRYAIEEVARPEDVLWHKKEITLFRDPLREVDRRFDAITEIFRLNMRRWLLHTSDPKQKILFADPESGKICSAIAPHVYNVAVVFRVRRKGDEEAAWNRVRVVVTRKGIQRVEKIL